MPRLALDPFSLTLDAAEIRRVRSANERARRSRWTPDRFAELRELNRSFRGDVAEVAAALDERPHDIGRALHALLGRTPADAAAAFNGVDQ